MICFYSICQSAGITGYYDENTYLEFGIISKGGKQYLYANEHIGDDDRYEISEEAIATGAKSLRLKMTTDYLERKLSYCIDGDESEKLFTTLNNVFYLCDEGLSKGKRFTGALVGMYVFAGENDLVVTFYEELYSPRVCEDWEQAIALMGKTAEKYKGLGEKEYHLAYSSMMGLLDYIEKGT